MLAAWVAVIIAMCSHRTTKKSLLIAEEHAKGRCPLLVPYLIKSSFMTTDDKSKRIYVFSVSLTNRSDLDNSIVNIQLLVKYHKPSQPEASLVLPHNINLKNLLTNEPNKVLQEPFKIHAHDSIVGELLFECDSTLLDAIIIDSYNIVFIDSNGLTCQLQPIMVTEIIHEER